MVSSSIIGTMPPPAREVPAPPSSLLLPAQPLVFTQDHLLGTDEFIKKSETMGVRVDQDALRQLHERREVVPLLRVVDDADPAAIVPSAIGTTSWTMLAEVNHAAREGRLRDPWTEGGVPDHQRPSGADPIQWWDGLLWSPWQLLDLGDVWPPRIGITQQWVARRRTIVILLCALAARHLPAIRGQASLVTADGYESLKALPRTVTASQVLSALGVPTAVLRDEGEHLIHRADWRDPLRDWLPLIRRMTSASWDKLTGAPAYALQLRIGAEILLRTHEELAEAGEVEPLPDFGGQRVSHPLCRRLTDNSAQPDPLDSVLADFGLVAYPRLVVLAEGETEMIHLPRLVSEFASRQPEFIRVQRLGGDSVNPQLLARYVVTPRLGAQLGDGWLLDAPLTALMIAIDEEGNWATPDQRNRRERSIRDSIRHEVQLQGGDIDDETLSLLIHVRTWGPAGCYELANFTDEELLDALDASDPANPLATKPTRQEIAEMIGGVRDGVIPLDRLVGRCRTSKPKLAEMLWPTLLDKAKAEIETGPITTPVVQVLSDAVEVALRVHPMVRAIRAPQPNHASNGPAN